MGKEITDEESNKPPWDSNAITPGTPFMDLLAASLRYWVVQKMNSDPGWKNVRCLYIRPRCVLLTFRRFKSLYRTQQCLVKENIKSWILFGDSGLTLVMTRIRNMLFVVWFVEIVFGVGLV